MDDLVDQLNQKIVRYEGALSTIAQGGPAMYTVREYAAGVLKAAGAEKRITGSNRELAETNVKYLRQSIVHGGALEKLANVETYACPEDAVKAATIAKQAIEEAREVWRSG